ncbi:MAG TPA: hypothetical protein VEB20_04705 [Azospirillaceae bacterium]|nr:hypothetical protein [Azospirillaceae bacterium]
MPVILFLLLIVLVAQIGFWDTLQGFFGALVMMLLVVALLGVAIWIGGRMVLRRIRR